MVYNSPMQEPHTSAQDTASDSVHIAPGDHWDDAPPPRRRARALVSLLLAAALLLWWGAALVRALLAGGGYAAWALVIRPLWQRDGLELTDTYTNDRPGDYYINQLDTGAYARVNCLPACMQMALLWRDPGSAMTTAQLRAQWPAAGRGWTLPVLLEARAAHNAPHTLRTGEALSAAQMQADLQDGAVLIVPYADARSTTGHAVLVTGYGTAGDALWFVAHDPDGGQALLRTGAGRAFRARELLGCMRRVGAYVALWAP